MNQATAAPAHRDPASLLALAIAALVVAGMVYLFSQQRQASLNRSQVGFAGLDTWLRNQEIETLTFSGSGALRPEDIGLRVLPLFDVDLMNIAPEPKTDAEILQQKTEIDISRFVLNRKIELVPSLVVLPKWRRAVRNKGIAHPAFLIPEDDVRRVQRQIRGIGGFLDRPNDGYSESRFTFDGGAYNVGLYNPQFVRDTDCEPVLGDNSAMLLGRCLRGDVEFWLLSDPDLLNDHGLTMADNARLGKDLIASLAGDGRVVIDLTSAIFIASRPEAKGRSWADLARYFAFPFSVVWAGFGLLAGLLLWRAWVRYGPIIRIFEDRPIASKASSIDATARLLRLSGHDRELLKSHVAARCRILAADLLGPHHGIGADPVAELARIVARRSPQLANDISANAHNLKNRGQDWSDAELLRFLDEFETLYERTLHEFGRSSDTRPIHPR